MPAIKKLFAFIHERWQVQQRRAAGQSKPWTKDKILQQYRFTCVYREDDAVTRWIAANWRTPHAADPDLWFAMTVARLLNLPASLQAVGYPVPWRTTHFKKVLQQRRMRGENNFNAAYIVSTNGRAMDKVDYVADCVLTPLWKERSLLGESYSNGGGLQEFHQCLTQFQGIGSFIGAQVIADLKYVAPFSNAKDWWTWAASGPGSRRGLNRVLGRAVNAPWKEEEWLRQLNLLQAQLAPLLRASDMPRMCTQDTQSIACCEFDKYERARLGEGRPKQRYAGV
jgi:hypothetical protein